MASDSASTTSHLTNPYPATIFRWPPHRKISFRRRRQPTVRLGGKKPRRGFFLVRIFRRVKLKWLKLKYSTMLKKLKDYYHSLVKDMLEGSRSFDSFQQRVLLETSFAIPVMGISFNSFSNNMSMA